jgi:hypothetical protein
MTVLDMQLRSGLIILVYRSDSDPGNMVRVSPISGEAHIVSPGAYLTAY